MSVLNTLMATIKPDRPENRLFEHLFQRSLEFHQSVELEICEKSGNVFAEVKSSKGQGYVSYHGGCFVTELGIFKRSCQPDPYVHARNAGWDLEHYEAVEQYHQGVEGIVSKRMVSILLLTADRTLSKCYEIVEWMIANLNFDPVTATVIEPPSDKPFQSRNSTLLTAVLEFDSVESAVEHQMRHGGKVSRSHDRYFWYQAS